MTKMRINFVRFCRLKKFLTNIEIFWVTSSYPAFLGGREFDSGLTDETLKVNYEGLNSVRHIMAFVTRKCMEKTTTNVHKKFLRYGICKF